MLESEAHINFSGDFVPGTGEGKIFSPSPKKCSDYYPFGLTMPGRSSNTGNPNDNYKFTGYEQDDEAGLNLYHAGARGYDPVLGRFMQIDRYYSKYPSLSTYQYAANNPLYFTDINGDSLYVENRVNRSGFWGAVAGFFGFQKTDTYIYRQGNWVNTETGEQAASSSGFLGEVSGAVSSLEETSTGSKLVSEIANGTRDVTVVAGEKNSFRGTINSGTVTWNPSLTESALNTAGNTSRPSFVGLGHEFAHAYDAFGYDGKIGITPGSWGQVQTSTGPRTIGRSEMYASIVENMIRKQAGVPLRTHYGINPLKNTGVLPIPRVKPPWFNF